MSEAQQRNSNRQEGGGGGHGHRESCSTKRPRRRAPNPRGSPASRNHRRHSAQGEAQQSRHDYRGQRRRNRHHHPHAADTGGLDINQEIMEQLRRQREEQQQRQQQQQQQQLQLPAAAPNPESTMQQEQKMNKDDTTTMTAANQQQQQQQILPSPARKRQYPFRHIGTTPLSSCSSRSPAIRLPAAMHLLPTCSSPLERRRLVSLVGTRRLLHSANVVPSAKELSSGHWSLLLQPSSGEYNIYYGSNTNDDELHGLLNQPAWTRSFDIWPYAKDSEPPQIISTGTRDIFTRDVHRSMRIPDNNLRVITCRYRALPNDVENPASIHFEAVARKNAKRDTVRSFSVDYSSPSNPSLEALVGVTHPMINDLCYLSTSRILLAPLYHQRGPTISTTTTTTTNLPVIVLLDSDGAPRPTSNSRPTNTNSNHVPRSDALCIEADYNAGLACTGFRNGQFVVTDLQGNTQAVSPLVKDNAEAFGSIHSLLAIGERQILARGSSGTCRLFDLRKLSSSPANVSANNGCIVTEYKVPVDLVTDRLTRKCRGLATDPSRSTVFTPMVSRDEVPALAAWSLHTGEYVGAKPLGPHPDTDAGEVIPSTSGWGVSWVELCSRVTAAWEPPGDDHDKPRKRVGSFALWYKTGMSFPGPAMPRSAGKIHQVVFDGQPRVDDVRGQL